MYYKEVPYFSESEEEEETQGKQKNDNNNELREALLGSTTPSPVVPSRPLFGSITHPPELSAPIEPFDH